MIEYPFHFPFSSAILIGGTGYLYYRSSHAVPKHVELFQGQRFDAIVTVCDRVMEVCPSFPDDPERVHWSFLDPASVQGTETEQLRAFEQTSLQLTTRLRLFLTLLQRKKRSSYES